MGQGDHLPSHPVPCPTGLPGVTGAKGEEGGRAHVCVLKSGILETTWRLEREEAGARGTVGRRPARGTRPRMLRQRGRRSHLSLCGQRGRLQRSRHLVLPSGRGDGGVTLWGPPSLPQSPGSSRLSLVPFSQGLCKMGLYKFLNVYEIFFSKRNLATNLHVADRGKGGPCWVTRTCVGGQPRAPPTGRPGNRLPLGTCRAPQGPVEKAPGSVSPTATRRGCSCGLVSRGDPIRAALPASTC